MSVADNGDGLTAEQLTKVFELFMQVNRRTHAQDGLGIGLALAQHLVESHGGTIEARSDGPGQGSEYVVRLPLSVDPGREGESGTPATVAHFSANFHRR